MRIKEFPMKTLPLVKIAAAAVALSAFTLSGCVSLDDSQPKSPAMVKRGVMTAVEIESHLKAGLPSEEIIAALERRGAEPVASEEVESLRKAGASHALINTILQINQPARYVWVAPPRFSFYFGRSGWYWVDSFGWPVYPQPYPGWQPRNWGHYPPAPLHLPVKPSPKQKAEADQVDAVPAVPVKPSPRTVEKDPTPQTDKKVSEKPVLEKPKNGPRSVPTEK
jgi:hypothetical protein